MLKYNDSKVTSFGGLHLINRRVFSNKFSQLINVVLGSRSANAQYSYSDLLLNMFYTTFCGGDCAEDINYVKASFSHLKGIKVPSADSLLSMQKELSTPSEELVSEGGVVNKLNVNAKLNGLLLKSALHFGILNKGSQKEALDFDHVFLPCEKYDSTYSYKMEKGYFPGVASIGNVPVYLENRNGNCHVKFNQLDTLKRIHSHLLNEGVQVKRCRMDSGSYIKDVCDYLQGKDVKFYIRAEQSDHLLFEASLNEDWKEITIGTRNYEATSIQHTFGKHTHRVVAYRWPNKSGQTNTVTQDAKNYLFIITNDNQWEEQAIIEYYNQRGSSERLFDMQNNDFNWNKLPFSFLQENTVYLILMAICNILYKWLINLFSKICHFLQPHFRLKKFIFRLVCIPAKVTHSARRQVIHLFTSNRFDLVKDSS